LRKAKRIGNIVWNNPIHIGEKKLCSIADWSDELCYQDLRIEKRFLPAVACSL
jgi:hypothetical protein